MRPDLHPFLIGRLGTKPSNALGPLLAGGRFLLAETVNNIADRKDSITVLIEPTIAFFYSPHKRWGALFFVCDGGSGSGYRQGSDRADFGGGNDQSGE